MGYEVLDISGDAGIRAFGTSPEEVLSDAAIGMYSLMTNVEQIAPERSIEVEVAADSHEGLLVNYLNELIFQFDTYGFIGRRVDVGPVTSFSLRARVWGEDFDIERHEQGLLVKAATYHRVKFEKSDGTWVAEVIFDI